MPTISTESLAPVQGDRVEAVRRRIRDGYYARPEVRRTLAELIRLHLLRPRESGKSRPPKSS